MIDILFKAAKVAELLGVSQNALAKMRHQGEGPPFVKIGRRVRYDQSDLYSWITTRRHPEESPRRHP